MSDTEIECQNHANCGDYCETPREIEMVLCEGCLDSYDMCERERIELKTLRASVPELVEVLREAERFIAGFEGCELQEGIDGLLMRIRAALSAQGGEA